MDVKIHNYDRFDIKQLVDDAVPKIDRIGDDILILDKYKLNPVKNFRFVAPWNQFVEVISGSGYVIINGVKHSIEGHCVICYLKGQSIVAGIAGRGAVQRSVIFSDRFMDELFNSSVKLNDFVTVIMQTPVMPLDNIASFGMRLYSMELRRLATSPYNTNILFAAKFSTLAFFYGSLYNSFVSLVGDHSLRKQKISRDFIKLLENNFMTEQRIDFYAESLHVSKCYLHECVLAATGKTPGAWVDFYLLTKAKNLLSNRDLTILQISGMLNYAGLSQFGKFFKKQTGVSPSTYRKTNF